MSQAQDPEEVWSDTVRRESDEEPHPPAASRPNLVRPREPRFPPVLAIALGVAALVLVWIIGVTFVQWRVQVAAQEKMRVTQEAERRAQEQTERMAREAVARQAQLLAEQQRQEELRIQAANEQLRAAEAARRAEAEAADRKEKAWQRFYHPPPHCETAATMECTNRYIRAKRQFEEKYSKGEL